MEIVQYLRIKARVALYALRGDQRGLETIEIVLIAALVIVGSIALWRAVGESVVARLTDMCNAMQKDGAKCQPK